MYLGYDLLHIDEWIVKIFLTAVVLVYNYLTRKFFIFRKKGNPPDGGQGDSPCGKNAAPKAE